MWSETAFHSGQSPGSTSWRICPTSLSPSCSFLRAAQSQSSASVAAIFYTPGLPACHSTVSGLAVSICLKEDSLRDCNHTHVILTLVMFECKFLLSATLDLAGHLSFQVLVTKKVGQYKSGQYAIGILVHKGVCGSSQLPVIPVGSYSSSFQHLIRSCCRKLLLCTPSPCALVTACCQYSHCSHPCWQTSHPAWAILGWLPYTVTSLALSSQI